MIYPTKMEANGRIYNINTSYKVALACFKALNDETITNYERFLAVESMLLGFDVKREDENILIPKIEKYLRCGREENTDVSEIDMDFFQDETLIKTSIRQCYQIDLNKENMHWYEYNELIEGLTNETILNRVRDLRSYDLSQETDEKRKTEIQKAKDRVALKKTSKSFTLKEQMAMDKFDRLERGDKNE